MLELKNINVSFRSERQDKIFGHVKQRQFSKSVSCRCLCMLL